MLELGRYSPPKIQSSHLKSLPACHLRSLGLSFSLPLKSLEMRLPPVIAIENQLCRFLLFFDFLFVLSRVHQEFLGLLALLDLRYVF